MKTAFASNAKYRAGQRTALEHNAQQDGGYHTFKPNKDKATIILEQLLEQAGARIVDVTPRTMLVRKRHG